MRTRIGQWLLWAVRDQFARSPQGGFVQSLAVWLSRSFLPKPDQLVRCTQPTGLVRFAGNRFFLFYAIAFVLLYGGMCWACSQAEVWFEAMRFESRWVEPSEKFKSDVGALATWLGEHQVMALAVSLLVFVALGVTPPLVKYCTLTIENLN